ncbi:ABC transporter substrate-binding protein [Roseomonas sp. GC11]|uniref:ABC transporter substrate-binding protein n=1 Tax=Roseomonas sp. GC11 TaxID=2950546 RepID=UPI0021092702|nr:ABC transporter substrate-binding protein [Roseomonas sp. GC11]MCQ4160763.1 ABC transporter substrate-binding protein [Roseomonas sp. GC11]
MFRRQMLTGAAGLAAASALPRFAIAQGSAQRVLKFIPQADLAVADPIVTTAYVSRNHGFMVWDTLYGYDQDYKPQPQMVQGHTVEQDGKLVTMTLRDGLKFHDGAPVLARDCVASIQRWAKRDALGQVMVTVLDELSAPDDKTIRFVFKKPFPLLFEALGKPATPVCFIMPERLAKTDAAVPVKEMIGSGPFRFKQDERVPGARIVYERFADYVPRADGAVSWTAGPKKVNVDRVEWIVMPDAATAASALQNGEADWWEQPPGDLQDLLRRNRNVTLEIQDPTGLLGIARFNHLHPPFNNPAIRRALLGAINQADFMSAVIGSDNSLWRDKVGVFTPDTPLANDAGMEALTSARDYEKVKRELAAAGYKGEKVVLIAASDFPSLNALAQVGNDMLKKCGVNVEFISTDWGSVVQRRASKEPPEKGGWSMFFTFWAGVDMANPGVQQALRGHGQAAWFGWPTAPKLEELRTAWFDAPDLAAQQEIAKQIQLQAFQDVPYLPLGQYFQAWAYRRNLTGVLKGLPMFWNVQKA